ncbi:uncharacterized protein G2W53_026530 [Senna tora]|uniref:Uncharacterized protein n=1 Tax=Senna tora TaxID=362788 RepID=A0A834WF63_9FABA|nr:uncharacterized protein G2W53_026530 [Senna tora]
MSSVCLHAICTTTHTLSSPPSRLESSPCSRRRGSNLLPRVCIDVSWTDFTRRENRNSINEAFWLENNDDRKQSGENIVGQLDDFFDDCGRDEEASRFGVAIGEPT